MVGAPGERVRQIQVDVTWPGGLYRGNEDGSLTTNCVSNRVLIEQVDDLGNVLGTVVDGTVDLCASTNTPQRRTYAWNVDPNFRYRVSMEQTNVTSDRAMDAYKCYWTGLKGVLVNETAPVYGDTTLIAIRMKATNGLASDATRRVGVDCTRRLPSGKPSHDPAAVFEDIYVNKNYGARRPSIELDQTALAAVSAAAAGHNGFNAIFDFRTTVWDAGVAALAPVRASPVTYWAQVSAIIDQPQTLVRWSFTEDNIVKDSIEFGWQFTQIDEQDSVEVEYRRIDDWVAHYVRYPTGGVDPEQVNLLGCTDKATAAAHAKYLWQRKQYRRKMVKFSTEMEGHLPQLGDLIRVTHRMNGTEDYVVGSISPAAGLQVQIEAYRYQSEVYA
jgi:hypothetical protein